MRLPCVLFTAVVCLEAASATLPIRFEPNLGQASGDVLFQASGPRQSLQVTRREARIRIASPGDDAKLAFVRMEWLESAGAIEAEPSGKLPGVSHYYLGANPSGWVPNVPQYEQVVLRGIYPGVNLKYYGNEGRLEYDIVLDPHADARQVRFKITGADSIRLAPGGDLLVATPAGELRWKHPVSFQLSGGRKRAVSSRYVLDGDTVRFETGSYDRSLPLVIDPVLVYSTLLGGLDAERGARLALDPQGNAYLGGTTYSRNFPVNTPMIMGRAIRGLYDAYIAKLNPAGTQILYSTYFGGSDLDIINAITVDVRGSVFATGPTSSDDIPLSDTAYSRTKLGFSDIFALRLNPDGTLGYSTYFGGPGEENATAINVDSSGAAYIAGFSSDRLPTSPNAAQREFAGGRTDAFVLKFNADASQVIYATHFGGRGEEEYTYGNTTEQLPRMVGAAAFGLAIDGQGNAWFAGTTTSGNLPLTNRNFGLYAGGFTDTYLARLNADGSQFTLVTYLGGGGIDVFTSLATDTQGNAYVCGTTNSRNYPVSANGLNRSFLGGEFDAFITKVAADGNSVLYSTYFGGTGEDACNAITVAAGGDMYFVGATSSRNFPVTPDALDPGPARSSTPFISALNAAGSQLLTSGFFGGPDAGSFNDIKLDGEGGMAVSGLASGSGFTTTIGSSDPTFNGGISDAFVARFARLGAPVPPGQTGPCAFTLNPGSLDLPSPAVVAEVTVLTGPECTFTIANTIPWVTLIGPRERRGASVVFLSLAANTGTPRAGVMQIAGRDFTIRQARPDAGAVSVLTPIVSTLAGNGTKGTLTIPGPARSAQFGAVSGIAYDSSGNLYISDAENHVIRRVTPDGTIRLWAGITAIPAFSGDGGPAISARLNEPEGLAVDAAGNLYVADKGNRRVRRISSDGSTITTVAGSGLQGQDGDDGPALQASFREPANILIDAAGNLYISDRAGNRIRRVSPGGTITAFAGTGQAGFFGDGGPARDARLLSPAGMAIDRNGALHIADQLNHRIRRVNPNGNIETVVGRGIAAWDGDLAPAPQANIKSPFGVAFDNQGQLYITDSENHRIRRVDARGIITTFTGDGSNQFLGEDVAPAAARWNLPTAIVADSAGNLVIADSSLRVRKITFPLPPPPAVTIRSITNAFGGQAFVSGLSLAAIAGANFTSVPVTWDAAITEGTLPVELGGVRVKFNNRDAAIAFAGPSQINFLVPADLSSGPVPVEVSTATGRGTATAFMAQVSPGLLTINIGDQAHPVATFDGESVLVAPSGAVPDRESRPARVGDMIALTATGLGLPTPLPPVGQTFTDPLPLADLTRLTASVGGQSATIVSAAMISPGVFQVRLTIPEGAGTGPQPIVLSAQDQRSQPGVVIALEE